jgi:hypothetical protein
MIIGSCRILILLLLSIFLAVTAVGQEMPNPQPSVTTSKKPEVKGPRAVAVLEWTARGPRLIPVSIRVGDQFYDASLYMAQPVPMALDSGVIYEVQKAGDKLGDFTLKEAEQTPAGLWLGVGKFDSKADEDKHKAEEAKRAENEAKEKKKEEQDELGGPPVLKRSTPKSDTESSSQKPEKKPDSAPSSTSQSPAPTQAPAPSASPTSTPEQASTSSASSKSDSGDMDRPILRRGKPAEEQASSIHANIKVKPPVPPPPGMDRLEVAVSDASNTPQHSYKWDWANPEEKQNMKAAAEKLAQSALLDYAKKTGGPMPGALQDVKIEAYDLSYSNAPTVVLSARVLPEVRSTVVRRGAKKPAKVAKEEQPPENVAPGFEYYVTVVGQEDIYGKMQKRLTFATDNKHLDAFPRLQLVGVVDADGNGNGDLLFESTSDRSNAFVIYRDTGWRLEKAIQVPAPKV